MKLPDQWDFNPATACRVFRLCLRLALSAGASFYLAEAHARESTDDGDIRRTVEEAQEITRAAKTWSELVGLVGSALALAALRAVVGYVQDRKRAESAYRRRGNASDLAQIAEPRRIHYTLGPIKPDLEGATAEALCGKVVLEPYGMEAPFVVCPKCARIKATVERFEAESREASKKARKEGRK